MALNAVDINPSFDYASNPKLMVVDTDYSTSNYPPDGDSTSSGGSGSLQDAWSTPAQRGKQLSANQSINSAPAIHAPSPYAPSFLSSHGPNNSSSPIYSASTTPTTPAYADPFKNKSSTAADSWESRREAMEMLTRRYRDSIKGKDN